MNQVLCIVLVLFVSCQIINAQLYGVAQLSSTGLGASYNVGGYVSFYQADPSGQVDVTVNITGNFQAQNYAIHVHTFGDLTNQFNGTSAGSHYPGQGSTTHGCPEFGLNEPRHEGDMGNWLATTTGITGTKTLNLLTLTGGFSIIGRAVILHMSMDNCTIQPTGGAGNYIGFGVIGVQNMSGAANPANNADSVTIAVAVLSPTQLSANYCTSANCYGNVYISQDLVNNALTFTSVVYNLASQTPHGIHVHTWGDLSTPNNGLSVGGHWNPTGALHALPGTVPRHYGDLGNLQSFDSVGVAYYSASFPVSEVGNLSSIIGRSVVIHALNDKGNGADCDQAGNSGSRILWGVIGVQNNATFTAPSSYIPAGLTINNNYTALPCNNNSPTSSFSITTSSTVNSSPTSIPTSPTSIPTSPTSIPTSITTSPTDNSSPTPSMIITDMSPSTVYTSSLPTGSSSSLFKQSWLSELWF